jgi:hypothetical protein
LSVSLLVIALVLSNINLSQAQTDSDNQPAVPFPGYMPTVLIDCPTAGTLQRGQFNVVMRAYPNGGVLAGTSIGLSNRFMIGVSYGAEGIIAEEKPHWNPRVEFDLKLSPIDEGLVFPAISLGFSSQGYGSYVDYGDDGRYTFKSKGFYAVGSKNYSFIKWQVGLHGGVNYSMEHADNDDNMNFFIGIDSRLNNNFGLVMEYDFAINDNDEHSLGNGRGYLNMAIQWLYSNNLVMEILLKNLVNNRKDAVDIWRAFRVTYVEYF